MGELCRHYLANQLIEPTADGAVGRQYLVVIDVREGGKTSTPFSAATKRTSTRRPTLRKFKRREFIPPGRPGVREVLRRRAGKICPP